MRSSKVSLATLAMASILPWVAASVSSADKVKVLLDPPPLPSGGSGVEVAPAGKPRWVQLHDFVRGEAPPLRRSDPDEPLNPPLPTPTSPPNIAFDGIIQTGTLVPPDTHIAVGPGLDNAGRVIMVTNDHVGVWDKTGALVASRPLGDMFMGVGNFAFDPKILFDQHSGRFFIVCLRGIFNQSEIHIAISSSGTPNNLSTDWTFLVGNGLTNIGGFLTFSDYPGIGADALSLFTTFNLFDSNSGVFRGIKIRIFDKAALLAGIYTFVDINYNSAVLPLRTTQPAHVYGTTANGGFYLISRLGSLAYRLFHITGHPAAPVATTAIFSWVAGTFPPDGGADQCIMANPDVDTLRDRIQNAIHRNGHIWCTFAADPDNDGQVEVVWQDILDNSYPTNVPTVFQSGFINGTGTDPWTYMPSINVNAAGDAAIVYTQSSTVECPNMYYVSRFSIDAPGTFQAPVLARTSVGFYDSGVADPDRWGDYSAVVIDPTDDCFWVAQEFVYFSGVGNSLWGTHIASFCPQCEPNELKKLLAFVGAPGDFFGVSVSISGDVAVVGASHVVNGGPGSAYVYRFDGTTWVPEQQLLASNGAAGDEFGISVAISGDVAIVGARRGDDANGVETGSAYVYRFVANNWAQEGPKLLAPAGAAGDFFGYSVAISGDVAIVGAYRDDDGGFNSGSAYVYRFDAINIEWAQEGPKLLATDGAALDEFGLSVAISGDVAIVGAYHHDEGGAPNSGSAYIYRFDPINIEWAQEQKLFALDGAAQDEFGYSVAISGDAVIVGAPLKNDPGTNFGSAYVYRFDGINNWAQEGPKLLASDGDAFDNFGVSVAISDDAAIVGVLFDDDNGFNSGSAYVYRFNGIDMWGQEQKLLASDGAVNDVFGVSVAISGGAAIVGALAHDDNGSNSGAAYVFDCFGADCNSNCRGDACDIAAGTSQDTNNNGIPDECEAMISCLWDLDANGSVGAPDLFSLLASWGPCKGCPADFDGNGSVGASDLLALLANWGPCQKK